MTTITKPIRTLPRHTYLSERDIKRIFNLPLPEMKKLEKIEQEIKNEEENHDSNNNE